MKIIGYVTLYIKVTSCDSIYYAKHSCDFRKPITEPLLQNILDAVAKVYEELYGQTMMTKEFVSQEEYASSSSSEAKISFQGADTTTENMGLLLPTDQWLYEAGIYDVSTTRYTKVKQTRDENEIIEWYFANRVCNYCMRYRYMTVDENQKLRVEESLDLNTLTWVRVIPKI